LQEELELLNQQNAELAHLRKLAEKQMEEALDALQAEREAKYAIKKDLDARMTSESMFNLSNLAFSIKGNCETNFYLNYPSVISFFVLKDYLKNMGQVKVKTTVHCCKNLKPHS
jgi:uncharacterized membrane protein